MFNFIVFSVCVRIACVVCIDGVRFDMLVIDLDTVGQIRTLDRQKTVSGVGRWTCSYYTMMMLYIIIQKKKSSSIIAVHAPL